MAGNLGRIVIVDYGLGNLASIQNMLRKIGVDAPISSDVDDIRRADKLILPGVGSFDAGMVNLGERGLIDPLNEKVKQGTPVLGICLGLQLMTARSEEGRLPGLGWIDGETVRFRVDNGHAPVIRVPHMGWNTVTPKPECPLFRGLDEEARFYFVHSYHLRCVEETDVAGITHHGYDFSSAILRGNLMGTQFHPEKSHKFGAQLLRNFVDVV